MLSHSAMLALQLAIVVLIALPVVRLALRPSAVSIRPVDGRDWGRVPHAIRVSFVDAAGLPQLKERALVTMRARSPGR